jgi:hypothetical protein
MESNVKPGTEPREEWATPELKKIDIEQITAAGRGNKQDSNNRDTTQS